MSNEQGLKMRFTVPYGSSLEAHLSGFSNARARNQEMQRLATNGLEFSANTKNIEKNPSQQKLGNDHVGEAQRSTKPKAANPPKGLAGADLLQIG